ncbi:MAG: metal ABC transporter permease, partial [Bacteroidales bacterium]|nr:metal ABC transporter permease [Bacteroidales bacterium]
TMVVVFFVLFYDTIILTSFDEEFAKTRNIPTGFFRYSLIIITALVIVMTIRVAGIILIISLLTLPQTTANLFYKKFSQIILVSILLGLAGTVGGLFLSYYLNIPSGACIILLLFTIFLSGRLIQHILKYFKLKQNLQRSKV